MNFTIKILEESDELRYESFLQSQGNSLLYYSTYYKKLIEKYAKCEMHYSISIDDNDNVVGAFPLAIYNSPKYGKVANSLPFYGSNGGLLISESLSEQNWATVAKQLTDNTFKIISENQCVASTFITNPFTIKVANWFQDNFRFDFVDTRIGQITKLPEVNENLENELMDLYDNPRPRNIRKAIKSEVKIRFSSDKRDLEFLYKVHKQNIEAIGGKPKEYRFFENVLEVMPSSSYQIILAEIDSEPIAGLLVFYYNDTVEYFTPATLHEYRNLQPSSLIIHEAMKSASQKGFKYWNWGGTWISQTGVYDFKKKWGAEDYKYHYYTKIYDKNILKLSPKDLLSSFPNFFVLPFDKLENEED